jgi:thymidylate synthase (FAD)
MTVRLWTCPKVTLKGHTIYLDSQLEIHARDATDLEALPVFAGRACYQSFGDKAGRRSAEDYLGHIIESQHYSVLEHSSVTFYIEGVSRSLTHELIRHRHLSFSQLSQRYVSVEDELGLVIPPADHPDDPYVQSGWIEYGEQLQEDYAERLERFAHLPDKQAREAARAILPNCTETKIVVTGNLRSWMEFLEKRDSPHADAEIQRLAKVIRGKLNELAPHIISGGDDK